MEQPINMNMGMMFDGPMPGAPQIQAIMPAPGMMPQNMGGMGNMSTNASMNPMGQPMGGMNMGGGMGQQNPFGGM
jgi:hypothetical protein